jgi:hypothetical protein
MKVLERSGFRHRIDAPGRPDDALKSVEYWELTVSTVCGERDDHAGAERTRSHRAHAASSRTRGPTSRGGPLGARDRRAR